MKFATTIFMLSIAGLLSGCATSSQVQEMIDASNRDYLSELESHENSIGVLKKSAMAGLEKSSENAKRLDELQKKLEALARQMVVVQDLANASKVMSAANTVKVSDLGDRFAAHEEVNERTLAKMADIDKLYEDVLVLQFQEIVDSANAAIESLKENGISASTNAPVKIDEPIQVVAPDTAIPTNESGTSGGPVKTAL